MREVSVYIKEIAKSKQEQAKFEAALHGRELNLPELGDSMEGIPEKTKQKLEARMKKLARKIKDAKKE